MMTREERIGLSAASAFAAAALLYAIFGHPAYGYFGFMKAFTVSVALYSAWRLYLLSKALVPLSAALAALAFVEAFAKMRRSDWAPWNWAMLSLFAAVAIIVLALPKAET